MHPTHAQDPRSSPPLERRCYECGTPAEWRIATAGEDERADEEDACERHAQAHLRVARLVRVVIEQKLPR